MALEALSGLSAARGAVGPAEHALSGAQPAADGTGGFGAMLAGLTGAQAGADSAVTDLAISSDGDLHDAVLAVEMESLSFELAVQIRNRLVDAYHEVFRMSI